MSKTRTVSDQWNDFKTKVIPSHAPQVQVTEMRRAFFAGFNAAFCSLTIDLTELGEHDALARLERYKRELKSFNDSVREGGA